jgi:hypothetical protein
MEGIPDHTRRRFSRVGVNDGLGGLRILRPVRNLPKEGRTAREQHPRRRVRREGERGLRQGCQRFDRRIDTVGRKRPRSCPKAVRQQDRGHRCRRRSAEAVTGCREASGPPVNRAEPKTPRGVPAAKVASGAGNTRGAGARSSFGWQTSVGRIARLLHREVARPVGEERALAGRKSVAPSDAGHGWVEGKTVRACRISLKSSCTRPAGFGLQVLDTMEGVLGLMPALLSPAGRCRVLWLAGQPSHHHPRGA